MTFPKFNLSNSATIETFVLYNKYNYSPFHLKQIGHPEEDTLYTRRTIQDSISQNDSITPNENFNTPNFEYIDDRNGIDTSDINQSESRYDTEEQSSTAESNQRIESEAVIEPSTDPSDQNQSLQTTTVTTLTTRESDRGENQGENMGENICLEEKLRQFKNDNKKGNFDFFKLFFFHVNVFIVHLSFGCSSKSYLSSHFFKE